MENEELPLDRRLRQEILFARERVYRFGKPTPLERLLLPGDGPEIWVKREDLSAVKSYKWRGACNAMAQLTPEQRAGLKYWAEKYVVNGAYCLKHGIHVGAPLAG